jgi:hypothetical protein
MYCIRFLSLFARVLTKQMWNVLCPVYSNVCSGGLLPQQSKCLDNEAQPSRDIKKEQDTDKDTQHEPEYLANSAIQVEIF